MLEPEVVGTDAETHQVTAIISHFIRPGREQGYEEWLHGIATDARQFKGHLGVNVIRPLIPLILNMSQFSDLIITTTSKLGWNPACGM